jgi:hypothetical protein
LFGESAFGMALVPNRFLFKFEFSLLRSDPSPAIDGRADRWDERLLLPRLHELDMGPAVGDVLATWNDEGLYIGCVVRGKRRSPRCDPAQYWKSDCLRLMTDLRDTRDIRRATRFCQHFFLLPAGGGRDGDEPVSGGAKIQRAAEHAPEAPRGSLPIATHRFSDGYALTAHLPAAALYGWDPAEHRRIGFYYMLEDLEKGQQPLTVGDDLNWFIDPSTWATAVLTD